MPTVSPAPDGAKSAPVQPRGLDPEDLTPAQEAWLADFEAWLAAGAALQARANRLQVHRREAPRHAVLRWASVALADLRHWNRVIRQQGGRLVMEQPARLGTPVLAYRAEPAKVISLDVYRARRAPAGGAR